MSHSNPEVAIPWDLLRACVVLSGPESQSSSAGAATKGFDRVEESVS